MKLKKIELRNYRQHHELDAEFNGNLIAVVGKNGCLAKGTPVRMADGSFKSVEDVKPGDTILAFDDALGVLTSGAVEAMIRTSPSHKPKPMLEIIIDGEKTCTTYDHPFFGGDGFYPLYQLVWGALEASQRARLKLLCEQYGAPFDDKTVWQQNSSRDEACARPEWILQDTARWAYREGPQDCCGELAGKPSWVENDQPYRLQSFQQQGGQSGVVFKEVQCVVWGNPWKNNCSASAGANEGRAGAASENLEGAEKGISVPYMAGKVEASSCGGDESPCSGCKQSVDTGHNIAGLQIEVLEAAPYYTVRMREAPYAYCIGRRNCYLVHNSGKSNFLGAIQFALTGEQPGFDKKDLLSWGESAGWVKLWFEHNGRECEVARRIESAGCTLKVGDEVFNGSKKVQDALRDVVGIDKDVLKQSVFVRQTEVESCLFDDPRERELNFQRLLGLGDAAKVNKQLGDVISGINPPDDMEDSIAQANSMVESAESQKSQLSERMAGFRKTLEGIPSSKELKEAADAATREADKLDGLADLVRKVMEKVQIAEKVEEEFGETAKRECPDAKSMEAESETIGRKVRAYDAAVEAGKVYGKMEEAFNRASEDKPDEDKATALRLEAEDSSRQASVLSGEIASMKRLLQACPSDSGGKCPLCGSEVDHDVGKELRDRIASMEAVKATMDEKAGEKSAAWMELNDLNTRKLNALEVARRNLERASSSVDKSKAELAAFDIDFGTFDRNAAMERISEIRSSVSTAEKEASEIRLARTRVETAQKAVDAAIGACEASGIEDPFSVSEEEFRKKASEKRMEADEASHALEEVRSIEMDIAKGEAGVEQLDRQISEAKDLVLKLRERQRAGDALRAKLSVLGDVRDWFSYRNGPRVLTRSVMSALTDSVNSYLDKFGSVFTVEAADEGMGFKVRFVDGRAAPEPPPDASMLSGGQKIALAVAFRFAVYTLFSDKLGLLSLDEPTAYLDAETIGRFGDLLQRISQIARNSGLQVLMATHESSLAPVFDQTIQIGE